jgi:hypothetical protein
MEAKMIEGKVRIGFEISPTIYQEYKDSGMRQSAIFALGLQTGVWRSKATELTNLLNLSNAEIDRKNEKIYFLGEKVKEMGDKLAEYQAKEAAQNQ